MTYPLNTAIGQTFFQMISSMDAVQETHSTTSASGIGSLALHDVHLDGTTIVMGDNQGAIGDENALNYGSGVAAVAENVNVGSGDLTDIEHSNLSETAIGHSMVQSNDVDVDASDGAAVALGGRATGADIDNDLWAEDVQLANQVGEDNGANLLHDESTELDVDLDITDDHRVVTNFLDSFKVEESFNPDPDVFDLN